MQINNHFSFKSSDRKEFASTILWLEDQKIRLYTIEDREKLRNIDNPKMWEEGYLKYKADLNMPSLESQQEELAWILSHAVRLEFLDDPEQFASINSKQNSAQTNGKQTQQKIQSIFDGKINGKRRMLSIAFCDRRKQHFVLIAWN